MGELIKTTSALSLNPYYIDELSLSIYSLEELSYCIYNNVYLIGPSFMNIDLANWIKDELNLKDLSDRLKDLLKENASLSIFVSEILNSNGYLTKKEIKDTLVTISEYENKSEAEIRKMRADRLFEKGRAVDAILEYQNILLSSENMTDILTGDIYHNLGTAYSYLFLFSEAENAFRTAYRKNHKRSTLRCLLFATLLQNHEEDFQKYSDEFLLSEEERLSVKRALDDAKTLPSILSKAEYIDSLRENNTSDDDYKEALLSIIKNYESEYESLCR